MEVKELSERKTRLLQILGSVFQKDMGSQDRENGEEKEREEKVRTEREGLDNIPLST